MLNRRRLILLDRLPKKKVNLSLHIPSLQSSYQQGKQELFFPLSRHGKRAFSTGPSSFQKPSLFGRVKKELDHYVNGSKLLAMELKISSKLLSKLLKGYPLIRREQEQLKRTLSDLFRLVPFSVFIVVPFLEFALPFALRLFPGMLPSTFSDSLKEEEKRLKQIKLKLQMAQFLQRTLEEMASQEGNKSKVANELWQSYLRCKANGQSIVSTDELVQLGRVFGNQLSLDSFQRPLLASICRYMGIHPIGTDGILRFRIRRVMSKLRADDQMIREEGGSSTLTENELRNACHDRGIKSSKDVPISQLREEIDQWIDLHLEKQLPFPILILSRALSMQLGVEEAVRKTLETALPVATGLAIMPTSESAVVEAIEEQQTLQKIQDIRQEERLIREELATAPAVDIDERVIAQTIDTLASSQPMQQERKELTKLKKELDHDENLIASQPTSTATKGLASKVEHLVQELDTELTKTESDLSNRLHLINSGLAGSLSKTEIESVLKVFMHPKYQSKITQLLNRYDTDQDGVIFLTEIRALIGRDGEKQDQKTNENQS